MIVNSATLNAIRVGFNLSFQQGLMMATSQADRIATTVPSSAKSEKYGWIA